MTFFYYDENKEPKETIDSWVPVWKVEIDHGFT
jgi:hypothetical protein